MKCLVRNLGPLFGYFNGIVNGWVAIDGGGNVYRLLENAFYLITFAV